MSREELRAQASALMDDAHRLVQQIEQVAQLTVEVANEPRYTWDEINEAYRQTRGGAIPPDDVVWAAMRHNLTCGRRTSR